MFAKTRLLSSKRKHFQMVGAEFDVPIFNETRTIIISMFDVRSTQRHRIDFGSSTFDASIWKLFIWTLSEVRSKSPQNYDRTCPLFRGVAFGQLLSYGDVPLTHPTVIPTQQNKIRIFHAKRYTICSVANHVQFSSVAPF